MRRDLAGDCPVNDTLGMLRPLSELSVPGGFCFECENAIQSQKADL